MSEGKHVYKAINEVVAAMAREGIAKGRENKQQGYRFRGIDEVYNALSGVLATAKLLILPRVLARTVSEKPTKSGGLSTYVVVDVEFDLVSAVDDSMHTIRTIGEAMDTADKATNKSMSAAMKYACLMAFQIPTEGDNDADAHHPEKASAPAKSSPTAAEMELAALYESARTTEAIAAADAQAQRQIAAKAVVNGGRERLLSLRKAAISRVEAAR